MKHIVFLTMLFLSTSVIAQETPLLNEVINKNNTEKTKKSKTSVGMTFDFGGKLTNLFNQYHPYHDFNYYHRPIFNNMGGGLTLHILGGSGFLFSLGGIVYGDMRVIGTLGLGGLKKIDNHIKVGGSIELRAGYDLASYHNGNLFFDLNKGIENIVIGGAPVLYINYNNFLLGLSAGVDYSFSKELSFISTLKLGFLI